MLLTKLTLQLPAQVLGMILAEKRGVSRIGSTVAETGFCPPLALSIGHAWKLFTEGLLGRL